MKFNEFQAKVAATELLKQVNEMVTEPPPPPGTESFRKQIESMARDLSAVAICCENTGITMQYVAEIALSFAEQLESEDNEEKYYGN